VKSSRWTYITLSAAVAAATFLITLLLMNVRERKQEAQQTHLELARLTEDTVDPAEWGKNFPREYDGFKRTTDTQRTKYGGSEAFSRLERDPRLKRIFAGYAFSLDYREDRGHAYSLKDQDETERAKQRPQPGSCLQCHASIIPAYRKMGGGDILKGFELVSAMPFAQARKLVDHPIACIDCHDPKTMQIRVTRPGFLLGIRALKKSQGLANYDPNTMATRQEMRTFVCAQCHVEYYFAGEHKIVTYPWSRGLKVEQIEAYYDQAGFSDWKHPVTGAPVLKAQHPEFETWSQGVHARSGVACADCHMPYLRQGAVKISDHHVRSPLLNVERACLPCHPFSAEEMKARVEIIQDRNAALLSRAEDALVALIDEVKAARAAGAPEPKLEAALKLHRKAQWRVDFVNAENSTGFHAPQEAARILGEAIDFARQWQMAALRARSTLQ
jgi:nitrite reductase (cytochrome c-552)